MLIDWSQVTVDHVRQACAMYDAGAAVPGRPAKNTFLVLDGKTYPAKFIRGLAYRLATGIELDPNRDFSGGQETVRFFAGLGLQTCGNATTVPDPPPVVQARQVRPPTAAAGERRFEPQKQALLNLLKKQFGTVICEAEFPWLVVPSVDEMDEPLASIYRCLQAMRGFSTFANSGRSLRCDFYIPGENLIVEYDERQHFTVQRARALECYPPDVSLGFDRHAWIAACESIRATDPNPPYRDEQRAFYDSLRDILAVQNGCRLIRFRQDEFDWTDTGIETVLTNIAAEQLAITTTVKDVDLTQSVRNTDSLRGGDKGRAKASVLRFLRKDPNKWTWEQMVRRASGVLHPSIIQPVGARLRELYGSAPSLNSFDEDRLDELLRQIRSGVEKAMPDVNATVGGHIPTLPIRRIALVSHDYRKSDNDGRWDYSAAFDEINCYCDENGCDTVLYSLFTWDRESPVTRTHDTVFGHSTSVERVILEVGDFYNGLPRWAGNQVVEIWERPNAEQRLAWQWFATSQDMANEPGLVKGLLTELPARMVANGCLLLCGENGVLSPSRREYTEIRAVLDEANAGVVLNPLHSYMKPRGSNNYAMSRLLQVSSGNRVAVAVWNQGKNKTEPAPWIVCRNGENRTESVREIRPIASRPDIRVGLVEI